MKLIDLTGLTLNRIQNIGKNIENTVINKTKDLSNFILPKEEKNYNQYNIPQGYKVKEDESVLSLLNERVKTYPNDVIIEYKKAEKFVKISAIEFQNKINQVAKGLIALGIKKGDKVAICSHTCFEWVLLDLAIYSAGAVTIPIYETSSAEQIKYIRNDSKFKFGFVENEQIAVNFELAGIKTIETKIFDKNVLNEIVVLGEKISDQELESRKKSIKANSLASIVYTSGSTGIPKGVRILHKNYVAIVKDCGLGLPFVLHNPENVQKLLLFLPLAHVFARMICYALLWGEKTVMGLSPNIKELLTDLQDFKPTVLLGVPRIFEKVYNAASHKAGKGPAKTVFKKATEAAIEYSKGLDVFGKNSPHLKILQARRMFFDPLVYSKLREVLGGSVEFCISGGAPLNKEIAHFFRGAGIVICEGYGMTETVAPISVNLPYANKIGSIGLPLPGVKVKIAKDGELLINAGFIFDGYNNNDKLTKETLISNKQIQELSDTQSVLKDQQFESGSVNLKDLQPKWILTGDIAKIDKEGYIYITGRKKEIIVTAGGKNVSPGPMEALIDSNKLVNNTVVIGDKKRFVSALISLDPEEVKNWNEINSEIPDLSLEEACENPAIIAEIQRSVDKANLLVSRAESIRKFVLIPNQFTEANEMLTPSLKIRRHKILENFSDIIERRIYS
ncbi:MAG: AMP-dependent synthetase/ligase [Candidatus Ancillula sp.]|jgi:long-chain acyl-CoA synthetase|nr:AMP-dependent synthetase/ligase [Candidatus Ancillula sp.]